MYASDLLRRGPGARVLKLCSSNPAGYTRHLSGMPMLLVAAVEEEGDKGDMSKSAQQSAKLFEPGDCA